MHLNRQRAHELGYSAMLHQRSEPQAFQSTSQSLELLKLLSTTTLPRLQLGFASAWPRCRSRTDFLQNYADQDNCVEKPSRKDPHPVSQ